MRSALALFTLVLTCSTALAGTPDDILAANRAATGGDAATGRAAVVVQFDVTGNGLTGTAGGTTDLTDGRFEQDFDVRVQKGANGFDGTHVWAKDNAGIVTLQEAGDAIPLAVNTAYRNANLWWRPDHGGAAIVLDPQKTDGGATYDVLTVTPKGGKPFDAWFDSKTHLLHRIDEAQANVMTSTTTTNYKPFEGVEMPVDTVVSTGDAKYDQRATLTKVQFLAKSDPAAYAPPPTAAADFAIAGGAHSVTLPFDLVSNHIYAHVTVNGKGPYLFVFDTGGINIVTPEVAQELGLKTEGHLEGRGAGEATMDFGFTHVDKIELGAASIDNQSFAVFPLDSLYVADGMHMPGMVGYETFRRFVTRIDYGNKTVTLIDPKYFDPKDSGAPIRIAFNGNSVIVEGSYAGVPGKFQIDTGSRSALTLDAPFVAANHLDEHGRGVDAVDGWGVGGPSRSHVTRGDALRVAGAISVDHPIVGLATDKKGSFADPTISGNIGGGVLKRYVVTFDYAHNMMYVKPTTGSVTDLDTYDRAGAWFNVDDDAFKVIDVTKGGPAEQAGLKIGDEIAAIDGVPAKDLHLYAVRERLRDTAPGTVVDFRLKDGRDLKVTLRDQI